MPKKTERGGPLEFFNIHSVAKHQNNAGWNLRGKNLFQKKSHSAEKNERGEFLVSPGMVCYAEKQEKPFWFSSLDQIVLFDAIIFCRTFVELFCSVRVDRKKRVTIIVAFHFMKRRLKMIITHSWNKICLYTALTARRNSKPIKSGCSVAINQDAWVVNKLSLSPPPPKTIKNSL